MILFGDLSLAATLGDRCTVTLRGSDQRYLDQDQLGFLGTEPSERGLGLGDRDFQFHQSRPPRVGHRAKPRHGKPCLGGRTARLCARYATDGPHTRPHLKNVSAEDEQAALYELFTSPLSEFVPDEPVLA
jgi:hypothetical protein